MEDKNEKKKIKEEDQQSGEAKATASGYVQRSGSHDNKSKSKIAD